MEANIVLSILIPDKYYANWARKILQMSLHCLAVLHASLEFQESRMLVQRYQLLVFLPLNSVIYMPIYTACVNPERAKFLKIHLEMEWVDLG